MAIHDLDDCPQAPTIKSLADAVVRMERTSERTASALEQIAAQGAQVASHEKRLDRHDLEINECFMRLRPIEQRHAQDAGVEQVERESDRFWSEVKLKLLTPLLLGTFFLFWLIDKMDVVQWLNRMYRTMTGG